MNLLAFAIFFITFGIVFLYVSFRNIFGVKPEPEDELEIDPETGEEILSGEVIETQQPSS